MTMKSIVVTITFLFIFLNLNSQKIYRWYQDGKIIFELAENQAKYKTIEGFVPEAHMPFSNALIDQFGIESLELIHPNIQDARLSRTYEIQFSEIEMVEQLISDLRQTIDVAYVEKKELHESFLTPNDPYFTNSFNNGMWCLYQVNAPQAWDISIGDANVVVAVTDNAIQINHPDLVNKVVPGRDVVDDDNDPSPCGGNDGFHGSHVSGTVGAETNNNLGVASLGYNISVMPIKIGNCSTGALTGGYDGIIWAADNGADAINMSWGGGGLSNYGQNVCNYAWNAGVILIAAAGNDNTNQQFYPAAYDNVVSVAATTNGDAKSSFSQYGTWIDVSAPGSQILSTNEGTGYSMSQGTSMASPMVASLVGLMISHAPSASPSDIVGCLLSSADNIESANPNYQGQLGSGRINAEEALICLNAFTYSLDAGITNIFSPEGQLCTATVNPQFELRNYGSQTLNSVSISYQYDGGAAQTINWTGSLGQGGVESISLPTTTLATGAHTLTVSCNSPNGNTDQNNSNNAQSSNFNIIPTGQIATVEVTTDCWGSEVLWNITEPGGTAILASGGPYTDITGGETYQSDVCLAAGCYVFTITDGYGDGMYGSQYGSCTVDGSYNISESSGNVVAEIQAANSDYGTEEVNNFCISSNLSYDIGVSEILNPEGTICDASIEAQVVLFNYGSQSVSSVDLDYDYGGGAQSMTYTGSIPSGSSVTVTLPVFNGNGGASTFSITTSNPDGNPDANVLNDNMTSDYYLYDTYVGLPFTEDFESNSFAANDWYMSNPDNGITWEIVSVVGTTPGDKAAKMDFFNYENGDERDAFQTPALDFGSYSNIEMSFEHAFRRYNQESRDSLAILISTDCGATFQYLASYAEDGTGSFATAYTSTVEFVPAAGDWCMGTVGSDCFVIDLNAYSGISGVIIKFESVNNGINGNNLFIDNINITGDATNTPPSASFSPQNSSICLGDVIQFDDNSTGGVNNWNWNFGDGTTSTDANPSHQYTNSGTYTVSLTVGNNNGTNSISATVVVNDLPNVSLTTPNNSVCSSAAPFNLQGSPSGGNYAGPGMSGASFNPSNAGPGTHTISYTYSDNNGCSASTQITITVENGPNVSLVSPESVACLTDNVFNLQGSPAGGTYFGPGMGGNVFTPSSAGIGTHVITYEYTDNNGCSASSEVTIIVEDCTVGIEENLLNNIILYPNPNTGRFTFSKSLNGARIKILSIEGKLVYSNLMTAENNWIDISQTESGVYLLTIEYKEYEKILSFIKK